uniref:MFS transporter n=1 Tax=Cyberlindnera americana TaxID=36016 RepID=A0A5P8N8S1_9ASCO|nr:MFS transporter [Cyberlindnera americana]
MSIEFTALDLFKKHEVDQTIEEFENFDIDELAHAQQKVEHDLTRWEAIKRYKTVCFYIFVCLWTMCLWGYESQAGGMVLSIPQFREDFGYLYEGSYVLSAKWQSAITAGPTATVSVAFIIGSWASDHIGRRRVILFASFFSIPWITLEFVATTIEVFFVGKVMNGLALGALSACCSAYVSEIAPLAIRGLSSASLALSLCIGPLICVLINNTTATYTTRMAYRGIFIPQWIFAVTSIILQFFIPESPYWLLSKDRKRDAVKELRRMFDTEADVQAQYALMAVTVEESKQISSKAGTYFDCFKPKDLRRTLLVIFAYTMQAFSGVSYVGSYSTYYYEYAGFDTQKSFQISCGAQALSISGVISSFFIIDRFGRRPLILGGIVAITILNLLIACTGLDTDNIPAMKASSGFMCMYNYIYNIAVGPVPYILGNELSSVFLRAKTLSMGNFMNNAFQTMWSSVLPYMFNADQANMGSKINFIFTGLCFLSIFIFYFFIPETAHRSFEEIDELFALGIPARQWASYQTEKQHMADQAFTDVKAEHSTSENVGSEQLLEKKSSNTGSSIEHAEKLDV